MKSSKKSKKNLYRRWVRFSTKKKLLLIAYVLLMSIALICLLYLISLLDQAARPVSSAHPAAAQKAQTDGWDGYVQRDGQETYLFIGTDGPQTDYSAQADTLILLNIRHEDQMYQSLILNRDTMTDVPVPDLFGKAVTTEFEQLALAHTYLENPKKNAANTCRAVEELLHAPRFDGYFSLSMDGIPVLADALGGIPVTIEEDFSAVDPALVQGTEVLLQGDQALSYIRARKDVDDQTNASRMKRHQALLEGLQQAVEGRDDQELLELYQVLEPYLTTNVGSQRWIDVAKILHTYQSEPLSHIQGQMEIEEDHWAFYPDPDSLRDTSLRLFYEEKGEME